jgi:hypothetical protein
MAKFCILWHKIYVTVLLKQTWAWGLLNKEEEQHIYTLNSFKSNCSDRLDRIYYRERASQPAGEIKGESVRAGNKERRQVETCVW